MVDYTSPNYNIKDHIKEIDTYNNILGNRIEDLATNIRTVATLAVRNGHFKGNIEELESSVAENNGLIDANKTNINHLAALLHNTANTMSQYMRGRQRGGRRRRKRTNKKRKKRRKGKKSRRRKSRRRRSKRYRMKGG